MSSVIAFTKDWSDVPTCTTHILRTLGKQQPVFWINSVGVRKPSMTSSRDLKRFWRKGKAALNQHFELKENQLRVLSPFVIPMAQAGWAKSFNRRMLGSAVKRELKSLPTELHETEHWAFIPSGGDYIGAFHEKTVIYYCVDDWSNMHGVDPVEIVRCEKLMLQHADIVFATSRHLQDKCASQTEAPVHYMPHGVDHRLFSTALGNDLDIPEELHHLPRPIVGFYGNLVDRIDFKLVAKLAKAKPEWSFVMVGPVVHDLGELPTLNNVYLPGRKEHLELPAWCKGFDVAMIPYDMDNPLNMSVNPIKAREILATGTPIVATPLPELVNMSSWVKTAFSIDEWVQAIEDFLLNADAQTISDSVKADDWAARIMQIRQMVDDTKVNKSGMTPCPAGS